VGAIFEKKRGYFTNLFNTLTVRVEASEEWRQMLKQFYRAYILSGKLSARDKPIKFVFIYFFQGVRKSFEISTVPAHLQLVICKSTAITFSSSPTFSILFRDCRLYRCAVTRTHMSFGQLRVAERSDIQCDKLSKTATLQSSAGHHDTLSTCKT